MVFKRKIFTWNVHINFCFCKDLLNKQLDLLTRSICLYNGSRSNEILAKCVGFRKEIVCQICYQWMCEKYLYTIPNGLLGCSIKGGEEWFMDNLDIR